MTRLPRVAPAVFIRRTSGGGLGAWPTTSRHPGGFAQFVSRRLVRLAASDAPEDNAVSELRRVHEEILLVFITGHVPKTLPVLLDIGSSASHARKPQRDK